MKQRRFGKTNKMVSEIGLGTWQLGTKWGEPFNHQEAMAILETAYEQGINFIDTADVYNNGQSEKAIGDILKKYPDFFYVVTKCGRALNPHTAEMYTPQAIEKFVDGSLSHLGTEKLDMILLHCPPTLVYRNDEIFTKLEQLKAGGKLIDYGVSIETAEEGLLAMEYDIAAMEVIFNMFRLKPLEQLFPTAQQKMWVLSPVYCWQVVCLQADIMPAPNLAKTTTAHLTAMVKPSIKAKPFRVWIINSVYKRWKN